jgi:serine/threonine protein kinase
MAVEPLRPGGLLDGRYRLDRRIGAGGMSVVWRAQDEVLDRPVAVKVLAGPAAADPGFRARVRAEARSAARLVHPHVVTVYDYAEVSLPVRPAGGDDPADDGPVLMSVSVLPFVVLELVDGASLETRLAAGPLPWPEAVRLTAQIAAALAAAHAKGLVHRDVTAGNVLLTADGAKVIDFGISAMIGAPDPEPVSNALLGTPGYLAPERLDGSPVAPSSDIYSLGILLDAMLTGHLPDEHHPVEPAPIPGLPPELDALRQRCQSTDPEARPAASEIAKTLSKLGSGEPAAHQPAQPQPENKGKGKITLPLTTRRLPDPPPSAPTPSPASGTAVRHRRLAVVAIAAVVVLGGAGALIAALSGGNAPARFLGQAPPTPSTAPSTAVSPSNSPSRTPSAAALPVAPGQCRVNWVVNDWGTGFTAQVMVNGGRPLNGWTVVFVFPGNQQVQQGWNGQFSQHGDTVTIRPASYNTNVANGQLTLGFNGSYTTANQRPTTFTLNGTPCSVG